MPLARPALLPWLSRDWHTPSLGWLVFCLFCIQNVACGLCFLLDFSHPVGPPLDVITQTFYAFRALRWEESQTWFLKSMERQFGRSGEGTGLHLAWRSIHSTACKVWRDTNPDREEGTRRGRALNYFSCFFFFMLMKRVKGKHRPL